MRMLLKLLIILFYFSSSYAYAEHQAILLDINGAISPATYDYILRNIQNAQTKNYKMFILRLDTPGGLESSMRGINKAILDSNIPIVTYVAPSGARAASAGTFILYASHIAAMAPGTNLGAASPVSITGSASPTETKSNQSQSTMEKKVLNDSSAYIRSLAELRGRNSEWAEKAVREAVSLSANEALKLNIIDVVANDIPDLLHKINGRTVLIHGTHQTLQTNDYQVDTVHSDWRYQFLSLITDPSIAYILLLIGIYGIFFELYNPGFIMPGVVGAICLLVALYAFQLLPVNYAGFGLLLLGITCLVMEIFVTSFGILGIAGLVAFVMGSLFLFDRDVPGFGLAWQIIILMCLVTALFFLFVLMLTIRSMRRKVVTGQEALIDSYGEVLEFKDNKGLVKIQGEIWNAYSEFPLKPGQKIRVIKLSGLLLTVEPAENKVIGD